MRERERRYRRDETTNTLIAGNTQFDEDVDNWTNYELKNERERRYGQRMRGREKKVGIWGGKG